jgi:3-oxoadipate enol-lactonase
MPTVKVNGVDLYYEEIGGGKETFVFARLSQSREDMFSFFPPEYHIYLIDLPGYGKSTQLDDFRGFGLWAKDIYEFSRKLKLGKFIYSGISMMGMVGFQLALDYPEVVKAFIPIVAVPVLEPPMPHPDELKAIESGDIGGRLAAAERTLIFPSPTSDSERLARREKFRLQQLKNLQVKTDKAAAERIKRGVLGTNETRKNLVARLGEVKVPTLLLFGGLDRSNPLGPAITSAMAIPGAKAVFFQDYGHGLNTEGPEKVVLEIVSFINELNSRG